MWFVVDSADGVKHFLFEASYDSGPMVVISIALLESGGERETEKVGTYMMTTSVKPRATATFLQISSIFIFSCLFSGGHMEPSQ